MTTTGQHNNSPTTPTLSALQHDIDAGRNSAGRRSHPAQQRDRDFSRPVEYTDYVRSVEDILAMCMTGFPAFEDKSSHRRSLIYLGYTDIPLTGDSAVSLYSTQPVKDMAAHAGVQINAIARSDVVGDRLNTTDSLTSIVTATRRTLQPLQPGRHRDRSRRHRLHPSGLLDQIRDSPPDVVLPNGTMITQRSWDYPQRAGDRHLPDRGHAAAHLAGGVAPMTFQPVLPVWLLVTRRAACSIGVRMTALYRVLVRTGPGRYRRVVLRWSGLTLAVLLLVVAAARPGLEAGDAQKNDQAARAPPAVDRPTSTCSSSSTARWTPGSRTSPSTPPGWPASATTSPH